METVAQDNNTLIILGVCGVTAVISAVIILAALLLLRIMRFSVFGIVRGFIEPLLSPPGENPSAPPEAYLTRSPHDLKAKAQELDFDAAVAKYRSEEPQEPGYKPAIEPAELTNIDAQIAREDTLPPAPSPLAKRRVDRQKREDEIFGGFMDVDGDGDEDF